MTPPTADEIEQACKEFDTAQAAWTKLGGQTPENTARFRAAVAKLDELRARNGGQYVAWTYND